MNGSAVKIISRVFGIAAGCGAVLTPLSLPSAVRAQSYDTKVLEITVKTTQTTDSGEDEVFFTIIDHSGKTIRVPSGSGYHSMNEDDATLDTWVTTTDVKVHKQDGLRSLPIMLNFWEDDSGANADDVLGLIIFSPDASKGTAKGSQKGMASGYTFSWTLRDKVSGARPRTSLDPTDPVQKQGEAASTRDQALKIKEYPVVNDSIELDNVGTQTPKVDLIARGRLGTYAETVYLMIDLKDTKLAASKTARLQFDSTETRGWYLEQATVEIIPLNRGFKLENGGPDTSVSRGSISSTSGVGLGLGVSADGGSAENSSSFSVSYSEDLESFSAEDLTNKPDLKSLYLLSATRKVGTAFAGVGGLVPYSKPKDLILMSAEGQFTGTPLNELPAQAKGNFPVLRWEHGRFLLAFPGLQTFE
ncbi:hypothetical protein [Cyanobium sp. LEGE 06113]|uniref:hypothetical protein n=1 Tax=Cyanobium sp. LEGE 06113 TaxID=1297573 RepID=UPI0018800E38|nr:hypothetical protein [Cyanobium sp. LEGE 06113]MBE9153670.1 hypothetical protein [Cyanobium sp. LEGE 06113]